MKAKATKGFKGKLDGAVHPEDIREGDILSGDLAATAVQGGLAEPIEDDLLADEPADHPEHKRAGKSKGK